jgi:hypothetical protein
MLCHWCCLNAMSIDRSKLCSCSARVADDKQFDFALPVPGNISQPKMTLILLVNNHCQ